MAEHSHTFIYLLGLNLQPPLCPKHAQDCTMLWDGSVESERVMKYEKETKNGPQTYQEPQIRSAIQRQGVKQT